MYPECRAALQKWDFDASSLHPSPANVGPSTSSFDKNAEKSITEQVSLPDTEKTHTLKKKKKKSKIDNAHRRIRLH